MCGATGMIRLRCAIVVTGVLALGAVLLTRQDGAKIWVSPPNVVAVTPSTGTGSCKDERSTSVVTMGGNFCVKEGAESVRKQIWPEK